MTYDPYITICKAINKWKPVKMRWNTLAKIYEPYDTGEGYDTEGEAIVIAEKWASDDKIEYRRKRI